MGVFARRQAEARGRALDLREEEEAGSVPECPGRRPFRPVVGKRVTVIIDGGAELVAAAGHRARIAVPSRERLRRRGPRAGLRGRSVECDVDIGLLLTGGYRYRRGRGDRVGGPVPGLTVVALGYERASVPVLEAQVIVTRGQAGHRIVAITGGPHVIDILSVCVENGDVDVVDAVAIGVGDRPGDHCAGSEADVDRRRFSLSH